MSHTRSWSTDNAVTYYSSHRNSLEDIYDSEKYFLSRIIKPGFSVLDLGCAAGGFYSVFTGLEPTISYTGVDISAEMISKAKTLHPGIPFRVAEGSDLPYPDNSFDIVFCSGALHMALDWREILKEGWRVARNYFVFDIRMKETPPSIEDVVKSYEKIAFSSEWDGKTIVPYIIVNVKDFLLTLESLKPTSAIRQVYGYYHAVSEMTVTPEKQVCMTMCCLAKNAPYGEHDLWDVPIRFPE